MAAWYEKYLGKPWKGIGNPPQSFNCGDLVKYVYEHELGIKMPSVWANASSLREALANLAMPEAYGFEPFDGAVRPFDLCFVQRNVRRDHVAIVVSTVGGLMFLHSVSGCGVILETMFEMKATTCTTYMEYRRHKDLTLEQALCHA